MKSRTVSAVLVLVLAGAAGCHRAPAAQEIAPEAAIVEEGDHGTIAWDVDADGHVKAVIKATDGRQITKDVTGEITFPGPAQDVYAVPEMSPDGYLVATGPALEDDLTEMDYDLVVEGAPWTGVLYVPRGGTQAIEADAKADASAVAGLENKTGPNGGVIQVIGGQRYEVVADRDTQEVRMYLLGPSFEVVDPGERVIRLGYVTAWPETVVLVREPGALYYVGRVRSGWDPVQVTIGVGFGGVFHYGILGFHFGERVYFGARAPVLHVMAARAWAPSVAVRVGVDVHVSERVDVGVRAHMGVDARAGGRMDVDGRGHGDWDGRGHGDRDVRGHGDGDDRGHGDGDDRGHGDRDVRGHGDGDDRGHGDRDDRGHADRDDRAREHASGHVEVRGHESGPSRGHAAGRPSGGHSGGRRH